MSELPISWTWSTIGDLAQYIQRGKSPKYADHSELPVINQKCIRWNELQLQHLKHIHPDQFDAWDESRFIKPGDILWNSTGTGTVGRAYQVKKADCVPPKVVDSHVTIVRHTPEIDARYLFNWVKSPAVQSKIEEMCDGTTNQIELSRAAIAATAIPVAPREEQTRIANQLDTLLTRIQACNHRFDAIPTLLKRFRQTVTNAACNGELSAEWRPTNDLRGWELHTLANVCNSITDGDHQAPPQTDSGVRFITISAINDGRLRLEKASRFVSQSYFDGLKSTRRPARGDLLFSVTGSIGISAQVDTDEPFTFQRHIAILKPNKSLILSSFIALVLASEALRMQVMEVATGTAQLTIPLTGIKAFVLNLPPIDEQSEIVRRVAALFTLADRIEAKSTTASVQAQRLTSLVLSKAFRGELVPQDSGDEPVVALMARIAAERALALISPKTTSARKPRARRMKTAPKETGSMTKSRHDEDVKGKPYLADHLRRAGKKMVAQELFKMVDLPIADFYKQLAWEVNAGLIKDQKTTLEASDAT
jgi:type I restriction enzyme, S subunit